ncbi:MAG: SH3 domain-containing protein [Clostridia bacterium]|nr:SH3 domain-containing protein [Clostridia bacterium]
MMKRLIGMLLALLLCSTAAMADSMKEAAARYAGYTFVQGEEAEDMICMIMGRPDGKRVVIGGVRHTEDGEYATQQSAPLPDGVSARIEYAMENKTFTLFLGEAEKGYSLAPYGETWGVAIGDEIVGHFWVIISRSPNSAWCFGRHPWSDMSIIDWTKLPEERGDVLAVMDTQDWATPASPNYHDRVHLRAAPRKDAVSLGKYYNGTPIRVLDRGEEWTHVSIFGVEGYMMTKCLAFGSHVSLVDNGLYRQVLNEESAEIYEWPDRSTAHTTIRARCGIMILAVVGDDWYHVWDIREGKAGYLPVEDVQAGNG